MEAFFFFFFSHLPGGGKKVEHLFFFLSFFAAWSSLGSVTIYGVNSTYRVHTPLFSHRSIHKNKFHGSFGGAQMNSYVANPNFGSLYMAEHVQYCIHPFHITKREAKSAPVFKQKNGQTSFCCKVRVFCEHTIIEGPLIIQDVEKLWRKRIGSSCGMFLRSYPL